MPDDLSGIDRLVPLAFFTAKRAIFAATDRDNPLSFIQVVSVFDDPPVRRFCHIYPDAICDFVRGWRQRRIEETVNRFFQQSCPERDVLVDFVIDDFRPGSNGLSKMSRRSGYSAF